MYLSQKAKKDLHWWITYSKDNHKRISLRNADVTVQTDASNLDWGTKGENTEASYAPRDIYNTDETGMHLLSCPTR